MRTRMHYTSTVVPGDYMEFNFLVTSPPTPRQFLLFVSFHVGVHVIGSFGLSHNAL